MEISNFVKIFLKTFFVILFFSSCKYVDYNKQDKDKLLENELKAINWNQVDEYPSIKECDKIEDRNQCKQCFFEFLSFEIKNKINTDTLFKINTKPDSIAIKVTVFADSRLQFKTKIEDDSINLSQKIDSLVTLQLNTLKVNPALKRGLPVKTEFWLTIVLNQKKP